MWVRVALRLRSFCFAAAACIAATLLSWVSGAASSCFHLAIVICSLYGGRGAGLFSIGLAALSFDYFFLSSHFRFAPELSTYPRFAAFIATALCINLAIAAKQRAERARREAIEDRQAASHALQKIEQRLARAAQVATLGEASAAIAHEIHQPLTAIIADAHMCFESLSNDPTDVNEARSLVQDILDSGYHATDVVKRIRALFKGVPFQRAPLDINEVVNEVCRLLGVEAEKRRVNLEIDLEAPLPAILGDRVQIQQVLVNLCINGMDAMDSVAEWRRTLTLRTKLHDSSAIRVEVQDGGIGLEKPDRVFETFFTTKQHGMGMGLSISRSIIELHRGHLWPQSSDATGTIFCFTLPMPTPEVHCGDGQPPSEASALAGIHPPMSDPPAISPARDCISPEEVRHEPLRCF
jgi:signal transduction histidine kinase